MVPGTILGHEGVGVIEAVGRDARNFKPGDRVVIASTVSCGYCAYCRAGYSSQCDTANPNVPAAGTAFFGGPKETGPFQGLQAEYARIPYAASPRATQHVGICHDRHHERTTLCAPAHGYRTRCAQDKR